MSRQYRAQHLGGLWLHERPTPEGSANEIIAPAKKATAKKKLATKKAPTKKLAAKKRCLF